MKWETHYAMGNDQSEQGKGTTVAITYGKRVRNAGTTAKMQNEYPENNSVAKTVGTLGFRSAGIRTRTAG